MALGDRIGHAGLREGIAARGEIRRRTHNLLRLVGLLWKTSPSLLTIQVVLYVAQGLLPGASVYLTKVSIDVLTRIVQGDRSLIGTGVWLLLISALIQVIVLGVSLGISLSERYLTLGFTQTVESMVITKAQRLPLAFFDQPQSYDQLQRARSGFGERGLAIISAVLRTGSALVTLASYLVIFAQVNIWLSLVLLPVAVLSLILNLRWGRDRYKLAREQTSTQREAGYLLALLTGLEAAKEIRLFELGPYLAGQWLRKFLQVREQNLSLFRTQSLANVGNSLANLVLSLGVMVWLFVGLINGNVTLGTYTALSSAVVASIALMPQIAANVSQVYEHSLFSEDLFQFLDLEEERHTGNLPFPNPCRTIAVKNLSFRYPGTNRLVLKNVSFSFKAGEHIAVVGENGSGKSTLAKCMLGLYQPQHGVIEYDGVDLSSIDLKSFRRRVTAVFQDFMHYALTVRENVGFGDIAKLQDTAALDDVACKTGLLNIINALPERWDSRLGRMWHGGSELSIGQWQRLAIARSLLRDADILIWDEPTASLDPKTESALLEQFAAVTRGKTCLIISHRLAMARNADRILVLHHGELVEEGTHEELLARNGEYARMFRAQAQWYE